MSEDDGWMGFQYSIDAGAGSLNVSVVLELVATAEPVSGLTSAYAIQIDLFSLPERPGCFERTPDPLLSCAVK